VFDSGIATWFAKRWYDGVRPITAAQCLLADEDMLVWQGPYRGLATGKGADWVPYQSPTFVTPPFAEYTSGHSGFSAAAAEVLKSFFGSDDFNYSYTIKAGESLFEPRVVDENDPRYVASTFSSSSFPSLSLTLFFLSLSLWLWLYLFLFLSVSQSLDISFPALTPCPHLFTFHRLLRRCQHWYRYHRIQSRFRYCVELGNLLRCC